MSQSFGKSFPDISEDAEDVPDGRELLGDKEELCGDKMRLSSSFTDQSLCQSPSLAPAKPRRTMVTSYSNTNISSPEPGSRRVSASVRARVKMFESMSTDGKSVRMVREASTPRKTATMTSSDDRSSRHHKVEATTPAPTPTPAPVMSISSSSSATSCGYKDFLIDDDYIDQQQLIISSNREVNQNGSSLENTLKEKVKNFLANEKEEDNTFEKSDDDNSVRELFIGVKGKEEPGSSVDTLSEQASISSESVGEERGDTGDIGDTESCDGGEIRDLEHQNDIMQDVMDVNTLLLKLQSILMEVSYFE